MECPVCGHEMTLEEKDTSSGRDMRTYRCRECGRSEDVDYGIALWQVLSDAPAAAESQSAAQTVKQLAESGKKSFRSSARFGAATGTGPERRRQVWAFSSSRGFPKSSAYFKLGRMNGHVIVWDLETVPDLAGFAAAHGLAGKTDAEILEAIGDKFPKHIYHSIICTGALVAHREQGAWVVDALGAPHIGERTEKQLITAFAAGSPNFARSS